MDLSKEERQLSKLHSKYPASDGIRGIACLIVLIAHAITMFFPATAPSLAGSGKIGVWLFFVLSAFLLTKVLLRDGFDRYTLLSYFVGRFIRIFPLYIVSVFVYRIIGTAGIDTWTDVRDAILLRKGFAHLWTIPVEFHFYVWLPIISWVLYSVKQRYGTRHALFLFLVAGAIQQMIWPYAQAPINTIDLGFYILTFGFGILLAVATPLNGCGASAYAYTLVVLGVALAIALSTPGARHWLFNQPLDYSLSNWFVYYGLIWSLFMAFSLEQKGAFRKVIVSQVLRSLGAWSYPIYLFHWLVYMKLIEASHNRFMSMMVGILAAIAVGAIVHKYFEQPIELIRKKVQNRIACFSNHPL